MKNYISQVCCCCLLLVIGSGLLNAQTEPDSVKTPPTTQPSQPNRIPKHDLVLKAVTSTDFFRKATFEEIPATVIDQGILKWVPYESFKSGNYELNIYGDPDSPAGVELGIYPPFHESTQSQASCKQALMRVLKLESDKTALELLGLKPGKTEINGLTVEITPHDAEDAYGAWWIGIYDEAALNKSRASEDEFKQITQAKSEIMAESPNTIDATPQAETTQTTTQLESNNSRAIYVPPPSSYRQDPLPSAWKSNDIQRSRGGTSGGTVYVRGYYRKDGTYVRPHSRRK